MGIGWAAPTIFLAGTPEQHERYLPKIFTTARAVTGNVHGVSQVCNKPAFGGADLRVSDNRQFAEMC